MYRIPSERKDYVALLLKFVLRYLLIAALLFVSISMLFRLMAILLGWAVRPISPSEYPGMFFDLWIRFFFSVFQMFALTQCCIGAFSLLGIGISRTGKRRYQNLASALLFSLLSGHDPILAIGYILPYSIGMLLPFSVYIVVTYLVERLDESDKVNLKYWTVAGYTNPDIYQGLGIPLLRGFFVILFSVFLYSMLIYSLVPPSIFPVNIYPLILLCVISSIISDSVGFVLKRVAGVIEPIRRLAKGLTLSLFCAGLGFYIAGLDYYFGRSSGWYQWLVFGILQFLFLILIEPLLSTKFAARIVRTAAKTAESKEVRAIAWLFGSVATAFFAAVIIFLSRLLFEAPQTSEGYSLLWTSFIQSFLVFIVVFGVVNILIVLRTDIAVDEPLHDFEYHALLGSMLGKRNSSFLDEFNRTGNPDLLWYTQKNTTNSLERTFPWAITSIGIFCGGGLLFLSGSLSVSISTLPELLEVILMVLFSCTMIGLGLSFLENATVSLWRNHKSWKRFWISYWKYVILRIEGMNCDVMDRSGSVCEYSEMYHWWDGKNDWRIQWTSYWESMQNGDKLKQMRSYFSTDEKLRSASQQWFLESEMDPLWISNPELASKAMMRLYPIYSQALSWDTIVRGSWWAEKIDAEDKDYRRMLTEEVTRRMYELDIEDTLPEDIDDLRVFTDKLVLFIKIQETISDNRNNIEDLDSRFLQIRDFINRINSMRSLGSIEISTLFWCYLLLECLPYAYDAPYVATDLVGIENLPLETRQEISTHARKRIQEITGSTASLVPDFLKWTALIYSIALGITSWIIK